MRLLLLKCPSCGGSLSVDEGRTFTFCQYCGTKILLDDENKFTYRHIDDADIKRAETERLVQLKELELEKEKRNNRKYIIIGWASLTALLFITGIILIATGNEGAQTAGFLAIGIGMNVALWGALFLFIPKGNKSNQDNNNASDSANETNTVISSGESGKADSTQNKGKDLKYQITLNASEAINGTTKSVQLQKSVKCKVCNGSGFQIVPTATTCPTCKGFGKIPQQTQTLFGTTTIAKTCPICNGRETALKNPCGQCSGTGKIKSLKNLPVKIPASVSAGQILTIKGEGESSEFGGPSGDLYIEIIVN